VADKRPHRMICDLPLPPGATGSHAEFQGGVGGGWLTPVGRLWAFGAGNTTKPAAEREVVIHEASRAEGEKGWGWCGQVSFAMTTFPTYVIMVCRTFQNAIQPRRVGLGQVGLGWVGIPWDGGLEGSGFESCGQRFEARRHTYLQCFNTRACAPTVRPEEARRASSAVGSLTNQAKATE